MKQGRLSAIVDWECAGFRLEYSGFTKDIYGIWEDKEKAGIFRRVFDDRYKRELEAERKLWDITPFGS